MDATQLSVWFTRAEIDIEKGRFVAAGGVSNHRVGDTLQLTVAGVPIGEPHIDTAASEQTDENHHPAGCTWRLNCVLPSSVPLALSVFVTIEIERDGAIASAQRLRLQLRDGLLGEPRRIVIPIDETAASLGPSGRRALLASRPFWQRWTSSELRWRHLRDAVVAQMIARGEHHGDLWVRLMTGDLVCANPDLDAVIACRFFLVGHYEQGLTDWIVRALQPGDTFIDVGSCYGHIAMAAARIVGQTGRVIAIEAARDSADRIADALKRNRHTNIRLLRCAVSATPGTVSLAVNSLNIGGNRLVQADTTADAEATVRATLSELTVVNLDEPQRGRPRPLTEEERRRLTVDVVETPARTLDDIVAESGGPVTLVKMDIEGAELLALHGATRLLAGEFGPLPMFTVEYSNLFATLGGKRSEIFDLLSAAGLQAFRLRHGKFAGGPLVPIPTEADAPHHDDLIFLPAHRDPAEFGMVAG